MRFSGAALEKEGCWGENETKKAASSTEAAQKNSALKKRGVRVSSEKIRHGKSEGKCSTVTGIVSSGKKIEGMSAMLRSVVEENVIGGTQRILKMGKW